MMNYQKKTVTFVKKSKIISKKYYSELVYSGKYLKAKIKSYNGKINASFHNKKIAKEGSEFICLSVILIYSFFRMGKSYYFQMSLEECKYDVKEKKIPQCIIDNTEASADYERGDSDEEISIKENSDEENFDEENYV